jgi:hypothetical protein
MNYRSRIRDHVAAAFLAVRLPSLNCGTIETWPRINAGMAAVLRIVNVLVTLLSHRGFLTCLLHQFHLGQPAMFVESIWATTGLGLWLRRNGCTVRCGEAP